MKRLAILLLSVALFGSALLVSLRAEEADPARAFRRGNELLKEARQAEVKAAPDLLSQAEQQYRACLEAETATPGSTELFDNARYNLELTKLLKSQLGQAEAKPDPQAANEAAAKTDKPSGGEAVAKAESAPKPPDSKPANAEPDTAVQMGEMSNPFDQCPT